MPARRARSVSRSPDNARWRVICTWAAITWARAARLDSASGTSTLRAISCNTRASKRRRALPIRRPRWVCRQRSSGAAGGAVDGVGDGVVGGAAGGGGGWVWGGGSSGAAGGAVDGGVDGVLDGAAGGVAQGAAAGAVGVGSAMVYCQSN